MPNGAVKDAYIAGNDIPRGAGRQGTIPLLTPSSRTLKAFDRNEAYRLFCSAPTMNAVQPLMIGEPGLEQNDSPSTESTDGFGGAMAQSTALEHSTMMGG